MRISTSGIIQNARNLCGKQKLAMLSAALLAVSVHTTPAHALSINIVAGTTLAGNTAALDAFNRAATQWSSVITDNITVNINADLQSLSSTTIIGQASSVTLTNSFDIIRNAMVADSATEPDDGVVAALPTAAQFSALLPIGFNLNGGLSATKANLKALGFTGLDTIFGATDATITFNTDFAFDFDNSNGVGAGLVDFETVAAHEIGHALGFTSIIDVIDNLIDTGQTGAISPTTLDLFRFGDGTANDPENLADFTSAARNLVPGDSAIFDDLTTELALSTGRTQGDGRQASHWKDNGLTGILLGNLDPTLASGVIVPVGQNDLRLLDLIGYDIAFSAVPVPASIWLFGSGLLGLIGIARRKKG